MRFPHRPSFALSALALTAAALPGVALAHGGDHAGHGERGARSAPAPSQIALPDGFQPEGIAAGPRRQLFVGSIPTGAIYTADARTGLGRVLVKGREGRAALGLKVSGKRLVVAGGPTGHAFIYNAKTGADVADLPLTTGPSFVNDVVIAGGAAWFTDSLQPQLYRVSLRTHGKAKAKRHGKGKGAGRGKHAAPQPTAPAVTTVPITGALQYDDDPATFEANGIVALRGGRQLLVVQSRTGKLYRVDAATGTSTEVPLTGGDLANGDGMLLKGRTLYVVQNRLNRIAVVRLDRRATSGKIERTITSSAFRVPTTIARHGRDLFAVNARFGTPATPTTDYDVVRVAAK